MAAEVLAFPCRALGRYWDFTKLACATPFAPAAATIQEPLLSPDGRVEAAPRARAGSCKVFPVVFGSAFLQYTWSSGVGDFLKPLVLVKTLGANTFEYGLLDAMQSVLDVVLKLLGWTLYQQSLLLKSPRGCLALGVAFALLGLAGVCVALSLGAGTSGIACFFFANYLLTQGREMFWTVWSPRLRKDGGRVMSKVGAHGPVDVSAKMTQFQVVTSCVI